MASRLPSAFVSVGALYLGTDRGLASSMLTARARGSRAYLVATAMISASHGRVTDVTDVPVDTVQAQLEHIRAVVAIDGVHIGALAGHKTADAVFRTVEQLAVPTVLELQLSGPSGETVLTSRGIETVAQHLAIPNIVVVSRLDAELFTGGEISSLDDAQVAAHRIVKRGARAVVIKCGPLPARFFEVEGAERPDAVFNSDLYFDGDDFALFEAPHLVDVNDEGAASAFSMTILDALSRGHSDSEAVQQGKQFASEALRATQELGAGAPLQYFWRSPLQP